jgi:predicted nucleic acid-binding protein
VKEVVIDANVAAALLLELSYSPRARDAIRSAERIIAPDIVVHEFTNVLWKLATGGRMTDGFARRALVSLDGLISDFVAGRPLAHDALRIAIEFTHPVYDCFYLALARERDATLMTADRRLAARVAHSEFAARLHLIEP